MEHEHHGKSSSKFLNADEILSEFNFQGNETFMDAGCGDGYVSKRAVEEYLPNGKVYAVDVYDESIADMQEYKNNNGISNLINIRADISQEIDGIGQESVDMILMLNVFHGFKPSNQMDDVIAQLKKLLKPNGKIAIMDFKPIEMSFGPPIEIRISHVELEGLLVRHGFEKVHLNVEMGVDCPEGKSHYLAIFEKE